MNYQTLKVEEDEPVLTVTLNRPDVHNAFNDELIRETIDLFEVLPARGGLRAVVLRGEGPSFCAGADLNWMGRMAGYTRDENIRDSSYLAKMFAIMDECPIPLVGRVQGAAIGGGVGLVAVCDIVIATRSAKFGLAEVKLGILPAVISPYVISKIGSSQARALFLTGERFSAERAAAIGLVHQIAADDRELDTLLDSTIANLISSGPEAVRECKKLIRYVSTHRREDSIPYTVEAISERRVSTEGQGGMSSFLRKEKAPWTVK